MTIPENFLTCVIKKNQAKNCEENRRELLKNSLVLGTSLSMAPIDAWTQDSPVNERPRVGDLFTLNDKGPIKPLTPKDIPYGKRQILAWPVDPVTKVIRNGSRFNHVLLMRFNPSNLKKETLDRSADGVIAYSAICTHAGCEVTDWVEEQTLALCPCHFTKYDLRDGASVIAGDAPRPLPALALRIKDGQLEVAKPFTGRIGFSAT